MSKFSGLIASPAVRKIARELEIDLSKITGTGKHAMITVSDLKISYMTTKAKIGMGMLI